MFSIPVLVPSTASCDNETVYKNFCFDESTLQKKHNYICFNSVRECVASAILTVYKVDYKFKLSNILKKYLTGPLQKLIRERIMFIPSN